MADIGLNVARIKLQYIKKESIIFVNKAKGRWEHGKMYDFKIPITKPENKSDIVSLS